VGWADIFVRLLRGDEQLQGCVRGLLFAA